MIVNLYRGDWSADRRGLNALRSVRTPTAQRGARSKVYTAGLTQAGQLWNAAGGVSALASPILRYYALSQAAVSVMAASRLANDKWQPRGTHGLELRVDGGPLAALDQVLVKEKGIGVAQNLARALDSPLLGREARLIDLIGSLPDQSLLNPVAPGPPKPLKCVPIFPAPGYGHEEELSVHGLPASLPQFRLEANAPLREVSLTWGQAQEVFEPYPSLLRLPKPTNGTTAAPMFDQPDAFSVRMIWRDGVLPDWAERTAFFDIWTWPFTSANYDQAAVLPAVAGNAEPQHPLVTWFVVLYAFSVLARYHAAEWRNLLDLDEHRDALLLRKLVDVDSGAALDLVEAAIEGFLHVVPH